MSELQFLMSHATQCHYLLSSVKCSSEAHTHCSVSPVKTVGAVSEIHRFGKRTPTPVPSVVHTGHFNTYLQSFANTKSSEFFFDKCGHQGRAELSNALYGCVHMPTVLKQIRLGT